MAATIRLATEQDAEDTLIIYAPIVRGTPISFELQPPGVDEMRQRIADTLADLPWLVCEAHSTMLGYAYASKHRVRAAYQWSVDVSVYVYAPVRRAGVGRALYTSLLKILILQGFYNALAGIALPNPASVGFHEALGFQPVGVFGQLATNWAPGTMWAGGSYRCRDPPRGPTRHFPLSGCKSLLSGR